MRRNLLILVTLLLAGAGSIQQGAAQGTAFTYQGRLADNGSPGTGTYELPFAIFDGPSSGSQIGDPMGPNSSQRIRAARFTLPRTQRLNCNTSATDSSCRSVTKGQSLHIKPLKPRFYEN